MKDNKDILIQIALMWAVQYEKGNKEACDMLLGYYKRELGDEWQREAFKSNCN